MPSNLLLWEFKEIKSTDSEESGEGETFQDFEPLPAVKPTDTHTLCNTCHYACIVVCVVHENIILIRTPDIKALRFSPFLEKETIQNYNIYNTSGTESCEEQTPNIFHSTNTTIATISNTNSSDSSIYKAEEVYLRGVQENKHLKHCERYQGKPDLAICA